MRIGIDLSITQINQAGTGIYARSLVQALHELDTGDEYHLFAVNQQRDMARQKTLRTRFDTLYRDLIWTHGLLPHKVRRAGIDLLHMPANVIPMRPPCPTVVTILDTTIFKTPRHFTFWHRTYARVFTPLAAKRAATVLTISQQSKNDIVRQFRIAPDKVAVTYLAASPRFRPLPESAVSEVAQRYGLNRGTFILTVGTIEPRKNFLRLFQAFALLRQSGCPYHLVHAGPRGWLFEDILVEVERLELQGAIHFLGRVPLEDLVGLYNTAAMFVYPSLYEGFGLPVLEAMACGCPVVTSNISSLPEVVGTAGILVDPYNVQQLAHAMRHVIDDPATTHTMREQSLARARLFSWERCARETHAIYRQVSTRSVC